MERLVKGDIVVIPFPFSDLSASKKRPALILASLQGDDLILCQITSEARYDRYSIKLEDSDFKQGRLQTISMIRPNKLITTDRSIIQYKIGSLKAEKLREAVDAVVKMFRE